MLRMRNRNRIEIEDVQYTSNSSQSVLSLVKYAECHGSLCTSLLSTFVSEKLLEHSFVRINRED